MALQDEFRALVTTDLDEGTEEHELDVMAAMLRHDLIRVDATLVPRFNQVLDLLGRFAPDTPISLTLLLKALFPHGSAFSMDMGQTVLMLINLLIDQDVLRDDEHDPELLHIPDHVAAWAHRYSAQMRREEQSGLADAAAVAAQLVTATTHLMDFALAHDRRNLVQAILPQARFWLRSLTFVVAPELLGALRLIVAKAERTWQHIECAQ